METIGFVFFFNSLMIGIGLAMDAFSVSLTNGLREPNMKASRATLISLIYAIFQFAMPLIGWTFVHCLLSLFNAIKNFIPLIAFILLTYIGIKLIIDGISSRKDNNIEENNVSINRKELSFKILILQGIATSIDALSVGFTISNYNFSAALLSSLIIGVITFIICFIGIILGKKIGTKLSYGASILGGIILIVIGAEILISGFVI